MRIFLCLLTLFCSAACAEESRERYLAFQFFSGPSASVEMQRNFPPAPADLRKAVLDLRDRIGTTGSGDRRLGVVKGLLSFDATDEQVRREIAQGFDLALESGVAIGFHIDDQMFWGRLKDLNQPRNLEWLDWDGTPNTGRRLDWSATPTKIMPQLCLNSPAVKDAVGKRAALIGAEIAKGVKKLDAAGKSDLYLGVIAGSETMIGRDFDTGKELGYCALTNAGLSARNSPAELDAARVKIIAEFAQLWARDLLDAGAPKGKIYSHVQSTPPLGAFCDGCVPGFSTYPDPSRKELWKEELRKHGNPPFASCEGTALDPALAGHDKGVGMENYLASLFSHGAVLVNVFGWAVGQEGNPFRTVAENENPLAAYRKFLHGEALLETPATALQTSLPDKLHRVQERFPWIQEHGDDALKEEVTELGKAVKAHQFEYAEKLADEILLAIGK